MTADAQLTYPIKAVARLTGLSPDTIRAWERRYAAISPGRSEGGQRLYSGEEVARLGLLRRAVGSGQAIGRIAGLSDEALRALAGDVDVPIVPDTGPAERVFAAIKRFDQAEAERELQRASSLLSPRRVVYEVALPLMDAIGQGWVAGSLGIAQEHLASGLLRGLLGALLRIAEPRPGLPPLLLATPPGELHELGLLCVGLVAAARGVPVCYLGPQVPAEDLAAAAKASGARVVGIGIAIAADTDVLLDEIRRLAIALPAGRAIWLGGRGGALLAKHTLPSCCRYFPLLEDVEAALDERAAG
jgi:DNA-binding transcriptional MerR regulator